jgi:hypothetical protein
MPDDKSKPGGQDRTRIEFSEGVSEDELSAAANNVGNRADAVERYLKGNQPLAER